MNYFLHRISYKRQVSYPLLESGLLSIGWSDFSEREFVDNVRKEKEFLDKRCQEEWGKLPRSRNCLYRFIAEMNQGDIILVPNPNCFSIYKVIENAVPISEISFPENLYSEDGKLLIIQKGLIYKGDEPVDLGFIIKVEPIAQNIPRYEYADAALIARMKIFHTNACINDLKESMQNAIASFEKKTPINIKLEIMKKTKQVVLDTIRKMANPDKLENLIKWYCEKVGASTVSIPSKNASNKKGDVDVIAIFENLKLTLYIQAKFHQKETDEWAVEQITDYLEGVSNDNDDGYSRMAWVITTADKYREETVKLATKDNIILITGIQFAEMLLSVGFSGMDI